MSNVYCIGYFLLGIYRNCSEYVDLYGLEAFIKGLLANYWIYRLIFWNRKYL